jgi:hypothetical protein
MLNIAEFFYENIEMSIANGLCENLKSVKYPLF